MSTALPVNSRRRKTRSTSTGRQVATVRQVAAGRQVATVRQVAAGRQATAGRQVAAVRITPEEPPMTVDLCSLPEDDPSCIDLTNEPDDIVDLTLLNDTPIVCLETVSPVRLPVSSSRRSNRKRPAQEIELTPSNRLQQPVFTTPSDAASTSSSKSSKSASENKSSQPKKINFSCPICFDTVKMIQRSDRQLVSTVCGHIFCSTCLLAAIRTSHACPNCRKKLTLKQYHPIFI